ncbi:MAG: fibronectin type III domain-containing protein [Candidatus Thermoplasmatota archaeon]|nr:fibronectin type III domain-containing protein [Candidatus Thermoplasmatota archaeon]
MDIPARKIMSYSLRTQVFLSIAIIAILISPVTEAWSNGGYSAVQEDPDYGTHDWIADMALEIQTADVTFLKTTYHSLFLLGTEAPDNPEYIGDSTNHHIYFYSDGGLQDDICARRAAQIYDTALEYLLDGDYGSAAYDIGVMAHYISDPGVFGHTMGAYTDWGAEIHHLDYENAFESMLDSISAPSDIVLRNTSAYDAALNLAETITFGYGTIKANTWMDANYDWEDDVFTSSAMASLYAAVDAVAAAVNHLMAEAFSVAPVPESPIPPQPPASLTATFLDSTVSLSWTPPTNNGGSSITNYHIYRSTDPQDQFHVDSVWGSVSIWIDDSVEEGETYYYWVVAENIAGVSDMTCMTYISITTEQGDSQANDDPLTAIAIVSAVAAAFTSGGLILWRRRSRG